MDSTMFCVNIGTVDGVPTADITWIRNDDKIPVSQITGQAALDLYNSMTGEGLTMEDL